MKNTLYSLGLFISTFTLPAQIQITPGVPAAALINGFVGSGLAVSNVTLNCPSNAYGTFSNGNTTNIGLTSGAILTTGNAADIVGPNSTGSNGTCNGTSGGDPDLLAINPSATEDGCTLEFDLVAQCNQLGIRFVFGSEEYPEFVGASYNDAFAFFVTGPGPACQAGYYNHTNIATLPNNVTPVTIDNVNGGSNSTYYVNNSGGATIQYDGFTTVLTRNLSVCPCQTYHFKIAIADAGDCFYDSGVLINFFQCNNALTASVNTTAATCGLSNGSASATVNSGTGPYTYSWSPAPGAGQNTANVSGLAPGTTYTLTIDDGLACSSAYTTAVMVTSTSSPTATATSNDVSCHGGSDGSATVSASGGTPPYTYSWSPSGGTGFSATGLSQGTYTCTITDADGCSKTQTATITQPAAITSTQTIILCAGDSITVGSNTYAASGTYTDVLTALNGCDSTVSTSLTILPAINSTQSFTLCAGSSVTIGANTYAASGTYTDVLTAQNGCDSTVITQLSVTDTIDVSISASAETIIASATGAAYQWIDCSNGNSPLVGETSQSFTATANGDYAVIVTVNNCSDTSDCISISSVDIRLVENTTAFTVYPNPSSGIYIVSGLQSPVTLQVYNSMGELLKTIHTNGSQVSLNLTEAGRGIYILKMTSETGAISSRLLIRE